MFIVYERMYRSRSLCRELYDSRCGPYCCGYPYGYGYGYGFPYGHGYGYDLPYYANPFSYYAPNPYPYYMNPLLR